MTRHGNILSFDEARARGSVSSDHSPSRARSTQHSTRSVIHSPEQPQRLTYDPSFEQSFTATARSGSYSTVQRSHVPSASANPLHASRRDTPSATASRAPRAGLARNRRGTMGSARTKSSQIQRDQFASQIDNMQNMHDRNDAGYQDDESKSVRSEKKSLTHRMRAAKAERQFNKTFGSDGPVKPGPEQTSRPALYEMKMGKTHKRSSRMQTNSAGSKRRGGILSRIGGIFSFLDPRSDRFSARSSRARHWCSLLYCSISLLRTTIKRSVSNNSLRLNTKWLPIIIQL